MPGTSPGFSLIVLKSSSAGEDLLDDLPGLADRPHAGAARHLLAEGRVVLVAERIDAIVETDVVLVVERNAPAAREIPHRSDPCPAGRPIHACSAW